MSKLTLPTFIISALLLATSYTTITHAQSPVVSTGSPTLIPTPTTVKSDFALDLEQGEQAIANDLEAQQNQKDQKDNENVGVNEQGEVENNVEQIDEQDMEQSGDDLNQEAEGEDNKDSMQEKDTGEGEQSDNSENSTNSNSSQQEPTTNGGSQQESNQ